MEPALHGERKLRGPQAGGPACPAGKREQRRRAHRERGQQPGTKLASARTPGKDRRNRRQDQRKLLEERSDRQGHSGRKEVGQTGRAPANEQVERGQHGRDHEQLHSHEKGVGRQERIERHEGAREQPCAAAAEHDGDAICQDETHPPGQNRDAAGQEEAGAGLRGVQAQQKWVERRVIEKRRALRTDGAQREAKALDVARNVKEDGFVIFGNAHRPRKRSQHRQVEERERGDIQQVSGDGPAPLSVQAADQLALPPVITYNAATVVL